MKKSFCSLLLLLILPCIALASERDFTPLDKYLPVRSFMIEMPPASVADELINFVKDDIIPGGFNTIFLRVNYRFPFESYPNMRANGYWEKDKIKELVEICKKYDVSLIPITNLLGHQSWKGRPSKLLEQYPHFDEKPHVKLPENPRDYTWPNPDTLYCKSYCPNHPDVHDVIFPLIDEVIETFESEYFHAGMDEVFELAHYMCPRCKDSKPHEVLAQEVNKINRHLNRNGIRMMVWGDRYLDGYVTGFGGWSASYNDTAPAIDLIDKNVIICDWHYRYAEQTPSYFAIKGFNVISCTSSRPVVAKRQLEDLIRMKINSSKTISDRFSGFMFCVWSTVPPFLKDYREGSDEEFYSAKNYKYIKELFLEYLENVKELEEVGGAITPVNEFGV